MKTQIIALALSAIASAALASGTHEGGHHHEFVVGKPGKASKVTQTIEITMKETDDGKMVFEPGAIQVKKGETVRFSIRNVGELEHEFVLDGERQIAEHKAMMEKFPEMEHDDPNAIRLAAGKSGEIIWHFSKDGTFKFACLVPGHYEAGMHGDVTVARK